MAVRSTQSAPPVGASRPEAPPDVLPLRLSVTRGGLEIELTRPFASGAFAVVDLAVGLPEVAFPIDLSKGVKQFRHHRGQLKRLALELDLSQCEPWLLGRLDGVFGAEVMGVRVRAGSAFSAAAPRKNDAAPGKRGGASATPGTAQTMGMAQTMGTPQRGEDDADWIRKGAEPEGPVPAALSVSLFGLEQALSFDLVLSSHRSAEVVVDGARGVGLSSPPLALALRVLESLLGDADLAIPRSGRALRLAGVTRRLCLSLFPSLGFRIPAVAEPIRFAATMQRGLVRLTMQDGTVSPSEAVLSPRAIRLSGLADLLRAGDDQLVSGDLEGARADYLDALESAPGQPEILCCLAEIDAYAGGRAQSALGLLAEREPSFESTVLASRLLRVRALGEGLRRELHLEALREAARGEPDGALRALLFCAVAERTEDQEERRSVLDAAVASCPRHPLPRWRRFDLGLEAGAGAQVELDAEQLEAAATGHAEKARTAAEVGRRFAAEGHDTAAIRWLEKALSLDPDNCDIQLGLGRILVRAGRDLEGAELFRTALSRLPDDLREGDVADQAKLELGRIVATRAADPRLALSYLRQIGSRSAHAVAARKLEVSLALQLGDDAVRRSSWLRLLEAIELRWIDPASVQELLFEIERTERAKGETEIADFARSLLGGVAAGAVAGPPDDEQSDRDS